MVPIERLLARADEHRRNNGCPLVTLAYAQSLDGSLSGGRGQSLGLSGPPTQELTHRLRAAHDAILVGIGTVMADDPRLTVRLVEGPQPQPIVLDSHLKFPLNARLLAGPRSPWIATCEPPAPAARFALEQAGAQLICLSADQNGRVSLADLLFSLGKLGINSLMVEGGARVITSFLALRLVDQVILTIAPVFVGGLRAVEELVGSAENGDLAGFPRLAAAGSERMGEDIVVWGEIV